jgi:Leucine-rich repeat (LRR) protein
MATTTNAFWNQLNLLTGLPDLRRVDNDKEEVTLELLDSQPSLPNINQLLDAEYKKSIRALFNLIELYQIDSAIRLGEITRPGLTEKISGIQKYPDAEASARKNIAYIHHALDRLNFTSSNVCTIDRELKKFSNLVELNLVGNCISNVNAANLPAKLEILHLNCNNFTMNPPNFARLDCLVHIGLAFNKITSLTTVITSCINV